MTSEDKMRGEFEAYFKRTRRIEPRMLSDGSYDSPAQDCCWEFWKASRESLVIELPEMDWLGDDETGEFGYTEDSIRESIHAAGVKTK